MTKYFTTNIGRFRLVALLEGVSLIILMFIAMPLKYYFDNPLPVKYIGAAHGALFILYVLYALQIAAEHKWKFIKTTLPVLVASFIPFGTFYIDHKILRHLDDKKY